MILLFDSLKLRSRLRFREGFFQFWTTQKKRPKSTLKFRGKPRNGDRFNELTFTGNHNIPFHSSGFNYFVSNSYLIVISDRFSYHPVGKSVELRLCSITAKDFDHLGECNQDFVAPALYHIPLWAAGLVTPFVTPAACHMSFEVMSVRVREHPYQERTPSGVVPWTEREDMQQA